MQRRTDLEAELALLADDGFCADPADLALDALGLLTPPERISITDCAAQSRLIPNAEGGARLWSATLTPYINGIQDAMDDPLVRVVAVPGPARCGKTMAAENTLFKRLKYGPMTDVLWYLPGESDVTSYAQDTFNPLFELHPAIRAKIGTGKSDDNIKAKRVSGRLVRLFPANLNTVRNKQAPLIIADELDGFRKSLRSNFRQQMGIRARAYGNTGKGYVCSHPDAGWADGVAAIWLESTRGIWFQPCPHCDGWSSPCPTAEWRMTLDYDRPEGLVGNALLDAVGESACMLCPHCGGTILEDDKSAMLAAGKWVFEGQTIDVDGNVTGTTTPNETWGFWIHGTMSPFVTWAQLAKEYVGALVFFERTKKPQRLREVTAKSLGEVYEGSGATGRALDPARLRRRLNDADSDDPLLLKAVPEWVLFLTAAVDVGGDKFDVLVVGWGHDGESCIIDRYTLKAGPDGRSLAPGMRQRDWMVLRHKVMEASYPVAGRYGWRLPVASMGVDTGGVPGVTWKAREFGRQMKLGPCRGSNGYKLRLIKGAASKLATEIGAGREVNRDDQGKAVEPAVTEYDLGVHRLKELIAERLAVDTPGPGYVHFPADFDPRYIDEMTNEALVDDTWERRGPNETFDLMVYNEAVRQMLKPERPGIDWINRPPVWGRPVQVAVRIDDHDPSTTMPGRAGVAMPPPQTATERRRSLIERMG